MSGPVLRAAATDALPALLLRPWRDKDAPALVEAYRDDVPRDGAIPPVRNLDDAERWLEIRRQGWDSGEYLCFAVLEDDGTGGEGLLLANATLRTTVPTSETAEVGYWTAPHARGRGVAPRALATLTDWVFGAYAAQGLRRLDLLHQVDNPASCRVAEKAGYAFVEVRPARPPSTGSDHLHRRAAGRQGA